MDFSKERITRSLGLDVGDKRIGVALSDSLGIIATPFAIIERKDDDRATGEINQILEKNEVGVIVAGLPLSMDGGIGPQASKVKTFIDLLAHKTKIPIMFRDESLSTSEARKIMLTSRSKKNRRQSNDDDVAAAVILQAYLEEKRSVNEKPNP